MVYYRYEENCIRFITEEYKINQINGEYWLVNT